MGTRTKDTIKAAILSPDAVVWEGEVFSISSQNSEGVFDIMPDHARFLTLIENAPIRMEERDGTTQSFTFERAVLFFEDNLAKIYIHQSP